MFLFSRQSLLSAAAQRLIPVLALIGGLLTLAAPAAAQELRLLMFEQPGCYHCRMFNRDVAPIYKVAPEGQAAPLEHANLRGPMPDGVTLKSQPFVTPTFILIGPDGAEIERLTGYPGDDFFWSYIGDMITTAQETLAGPPEG